MKINIDVRPGKTKILAISINKRDGDFTFIQIPVIENLDLHVNMPENSKTVISSTGLVEVQQGGTAQYGLEGI